MRTHPQNRRFARLRARRDAGFRPRPARKGDAAGRRDGRLGLRNPARVQRGRRAQILEGHADRPRRRRGAPGSCDNRSRQPGRADRADRETPLRRRVQSALAGGVGRHPPHPGKLRVHREAMTASTGPNGARSGQKASNRKGWTMKHSSIFALTLAARPRRGAGAGAGVQGGRHRDREAVGPRDPEGRRGRRRVHDDREQGRDARPPDRRLGGFRHRRDP